MKKYLLTAQDKELIQIAKGAIKKAKKVKMPSTGEVGSALVTSNGNIYKGVSIGFDCGIGSCAEYQAVGTMITNGEQEIKTIVAISADNKIMPPCGKCREMIYGAGKNNLNTFVIISKTHKVKLKDLLPLRWQEVWK